jgi:dTDP-4-dehydrorhamnose reductase
MVNRDRVWLVGADGMLGHQVRRHLERSHMPFWATDREVDFRDPSALRQYVTGHPCTWIVNCAAYTAVDAAEGDAENAFSINAEGPRNLAELALDLGAKLLHISTDYVFNGSLDRPYCEEDETDPRSVYGRSKLAGETAIRETGCEAIILRISWLYGVYGKNFVETMLRFMKEKGLVRVVDDQIGAPSYAAALAENIVGLIARKTPSRGIFHYADAGEISWYDFARAIAEEGLRQKLLDSPPGVIPIPSREYPTPVTRPANSLFNKSKAIRELGLLVHPWRENLAHYFEERRMLHAKL